MSDKTELTEQVEAALHDQKAFEDLVDGLSGASRRTRQKAAATLAALARTDAAAAKPATAALIDALNRPEAQTRWEALDALTEIVSIDARSCEKALAGAETSLFDEESGLARLAAFRFLCKYGATTENRSMKTWPLIDEAIQCYHGDTEFPDMMVATIDYAKGKLAADVKAGLSARMAFDAQNSRGALKNRAQQIIDIVA